MTTISASVLGADLMNLGGEIRRMEELGVTWLHLDQMDGHFVPNISFGPGFVAAMRKATNLFLDVHLMLSHPLAYVDAYADAGADLIVVHAEAEDDPQEALRAIAARGIKAGICIKPGTQPEAIRPLLPLCDMVLVMTVEPGYGGQAFIPETLDKIRALRSFAGAELDIEVDGGINAKTAPLVREAGANVLVAGSAVFGAKDPENAIRVMKG